MSCVSQHKLCLTVALCPSFEVVFHMLNPVKVKFWTVNTLAETDTAVKSSNRLKYRVTDISMGDWPELGGRSLQCVSNNWKGEYYSSTTTFRLVQFSTFQNKMQLESMPHNIYWTDYET